MEHGDVKQADTIGVFLADDNLIVREGVRALIERHADLQVVGVAADYDEAVAGAAATEPQVLVTDIRMPPSFSREGIDAAKEVRKRHPGTGVVILSQYDDPEYAVSLLAEGSAGYGYLLKDNIGETERVVVTVLMSDIRSYSTIAEHADPSQLAGQLNTHRAAMNRAILGEDGTVMQFVGDAVMAVFGAPFAQPDHADHA